MVRVWNGRADGAGEVNAVECNQTQKNESRAVAKEEWQAVKEVLNASARDSRIRRARKCPNSEEKRGHVEALVAPAQRTAGRSWRTGIA